MENSVDPDETDCLVLQWLQGVGFGVLGWKGLTSLSKVHPTLYSGENRDM